LIGVPVAFTPGFGPHDDVPVAALLDALELDPLLAGAPALLLVLELLLLPHAVTITPAKNTTSAAIRRVRIGGRVISRFDPCRVTMTPPRSTLLFSAPAKRV
jgi:hypothetical protein